MRFPSKIPPYMFYLAFLPGFVLFFLIIAAIRDKSGWALGLLVFVILTAVFTAAFKDILFPKRKP